MTEIIFKKNKLEKKDFYAWLKTEMSNAGWQNISSRPASDNDVFHSTGESGEEDLFIRLKEFQNSSNSDPFSNNGIFISAITLGRYTPGNTGVAGVAFPNVIPSQFVASRIFKGSSMQPNAVLTIFYYIDKDKVILILEPERYLNTDSTFIFLGKPETVLAKGSDTADTVSVSSSGVGNQIVFPNVADFISLAYGLLGSFMIPDIPKGKTQAKEFLMSEIALTNSADGVHSILDGIYVISKDNSITYSSALVGDELVDEELKRYRITSTQTLIGGAGSYNHPLIAFRVE